MNHLFPSFAGKKTGGTTYGTTRQTDPAPTITNVKQVRLSELDS